MGSVYRRGYKLWFAFKDVTGKRVLRASGFNVGEEKKAARMLERLEKSVAAARGDDTSPLTFSSYVAKWGTERQAQGLLNAKLDQRRLENHAVPVLGRILLAEVRPKHIYELLSVLKRKKLAPRTVIDVAHLVRNLFNDAVMKELVEFSPYQLKRGALPKKVDKNPEWRAGARFERDEAERLISDVRIPLHRRVIWAVLMLTGMRSGELAAMRWRHYDKKSRPLGRVLVAHSFTRRNKKEKSTKTGVPREVPVHPTLATLLDAWERRGFSTMFGRQPGPEDLLVPNKRGNHLTDNNLGEALTKDLQTLGLRRRTPHNMRRTLISVGRADGAVPAVLRALTHDGKGDQFDDYTSFTFAEKCEAMCSVRVSIRAETASQPSEETQSVDDTATATSTMGVKDAK